MRAADLRRVLRTVGIVQIDSVNVLARSHYLPFFARLGPYDTALLDRLRDRAPRAMVEYWAHEASLVEPDLWPDFRFRMDRARSQAWDGMRRVATDHPDLVDRVRRHVERHGPATARQVEAALAHDEELSREEWGWNWSLVKLALEHLFWAGEITSAGRTSQFERRYAALSRVPPARVRDRLAEAGGEDAAYDRLVLLAARAHGIGTDRCLRDYARLKADEAGPAIERLVAAGHLLPARVPGWTERGYLCAGARRPRAVRARALLSPFDSLVWQRERTEALFGMRYRIGIYTPAEQREHGYYVLPFLLGEELVARVDLKADRAAGLLRVQQETWEAGRGAAGERAELDAELALMAGWLGLSGVVRR